MDGLHGMRVMGIDPGISHTGYGVVDATREGRIEHVTHGQILTSPKIPFVERLFKIHTELNDVFRCLEPNHVAVEEVFFAKNAKSALILGHARGVAILSAAMSGLPVFEYSATETKKAVCTYGRGTKEQVNVMVKMLLRLSDDLPDHASDALAMCICHIHSHRTRLMQAGGRE